MKEIMKIVLSNWVSVLIILIAVYVYAFISAYSDKSFTFSQSIFSANYLVFLYGILLWAGFFIVIALLDVLLFSFNREPRYTNYKLALEWIVISSPFIYWLIKYNQWIFLVAILAFLIGQYLRRPYIFKIME
jgi:hypothetical protein